MYSARIETDAGKVFNFGHEYGSVFDITPLTGADVDIATSQGFQQIGETVENQSVGGVTRTIRGVFFQSAASLSRQMLNTLAIFTTGKLYFGDGYYCDIVIKKTPVISTEKNGRIVFMLLVFCSTPFWLKSEVNAYNVGGIEAAFHFPVIYDKHTFSKHSEGAFVNAYNGGITQSEFSVAFSTSSVVRNFGIIDVNTLKFIKLNMEIESGTIVTVYRKGGKLFIEKQNGDTVIDAFSALDENSDLFSITSGDNIIRVLADEGERDLQAIISFYEPYMGVVNAEN